MFNEKIKLINSKTPDIIFPKLQAVGSWGDHPLLKRSDMNQNKSAKGDRDKGLPSVKKIKSLKETYFCFKNPSMQCDHLLTSMIDDHMMINLLGWQENSKNVVGRYMDFISPKVFTNFIEYAMRY